MISKYFALVALAAALASGPAAAHGSLEHASDDLSFAVVLSPVFSIVAPIVIVELSADSSSNRKQVHVRGANGADGVLQLPAEVVAKHDIRAGDRLTLSPRKSGALLMKNDKPVAYVVQPDNAKLSKHEPLAR